MKDNWKLAEKILKKEGLVILPTDTLYGIIASALSKKAVEKIYKIKGRDENKPFIVLINSESQLNLFDIKLNKLQSGTLIRFWPGKVSLILPCPLPKWAYIHRGEKSIAFRMIGRRNKHLFNLIDKIGPLVAPSVNIQGEKPAETIVEAKKYFGNQIHLYINNGKRKSNPSTLVKFSDRELVVLRQGDVKIKT